MKKLRIIIDVVMYLLFIILMGHHITGNHIHEILGTGTIVLFIIHNIINVKFYKVIFKCHSLRSDELKKINLVTSESETFLRNKNLFKGKYNLKRVFLTLIDILLLFCMIGIIVSSIIISNDVFAFLKIQTTIFGLKLHMLSTSWGFVIMSIHLGLHLNVLISKINKKMENSTFEYVYYLVFVLILVYGIYSFIKMNFISDMFLLNPFKVYNFDESPFVFYLHILSSSLFISLTIYLINSLKKGGKTTEKNIEIIH